MPQIPGRTRSIWMKSTEIISGENNNLIPQVQGEISSCWWVVATSEELLRFLWFLIRFKIFYIPLVHVISSSTWWLLSLSEWMDYYCWPTPLATRVMPNTYTVWRIKIRKELLCFWHLGWGIGGVFCPDLILTIDHFLVLFNTLPGCWLTSALGVLKLNGFPLGGSCCSLEMIYGRNWGLEYSRHRPPQQGKWKRNSD